MQERTIKVEYSRPRGYDVGYRAENNFTLLALPVPEELEGADSYRVYFESTVGDYLQTETLTPVDGYVTVKITSDVVPEPGNMAAQLVAFRAGEIVGYAPMITGSAKVSIPDGTERLSHSLAAEIALNTAARHSHSNKAILDKFAETDGKPTYDGEALGGGSGGVSTAEDVSYTNMQLPNVANVKTALDELVSKSHSHANKDILDKLSVSDGKLQYNGSDVGIKGDKGADGANGKDGANGITPTIGTNGNWYLGTTDTGKPSQGDKGDKGDTGAQGEPGKDGADGAPGADGTSATHSWNGTVLTITSASGTSSADLKGEKGDKGDKGDTGAQGVQGIQGEKGDKGDTGEQGLRGEQGIQGIQGAKGDKGDTGAPGKDGKDGTNGITPTIGTNGNWFLGTTDTGKPSRGAKGDTGASGSPGADGVTPHIGDNGNWYIGSTDTGKPSRGVAGARGDKGNPGADGAAGKSAYQYAQDGGYTGTETEFSEKLAQEQLTGTTNNLTPTQVYDAVSAGIPVKVQYTDSTYGLLSFTAFNIAESLSMIVSQTIVYANNVYILAELSGSKSLNSWKVMFTTLAEKTDIPTRLPNFYSINITVGDTIYSYDGSKQVDIIIDDGTEVSY